MAERNLGQITLTVRQLDNGQLQVTHETRLTEEVLLLVSGMSPPELQVCLDERRCAARHMVRFFAQIMSDEPVEVWPATPSQPPKLS